jgi:ribosomal protein S18 acetylase RimI-like enzyme
MLVPSQQAGFVISESTDDLDLDWVVNRIQSSHWGARLSPERIIASCRSSLCFSLHRTVDPRRHTQIGFARVVSDGQTFSSLMDVFIESGYRNRGLGSMLVRHVLDHPAVKGTVCILATRDKQNWYRKFGFTSIKAMQKGHAPT